MLDIVLAVLLGVAAGIVAGLLPGIHPNMIILAVPLFASLAVGQATLIAFLAALAISNTVVDFVPSLLLGGAEVGNEIAALPGHRLVRQGYGASVVSLALAGAIGAFFLFLLLSPLLVFAIPLLFSLLGAHIAYLLVFVVLVMLLAEKRKLLGAALFLMAGAIGMIAFSAPVNQVLILFPVLTGMFGIGMLLADEQPAGGKRELLYSNKTYVRATISGTLGGIVSGFLPGVGSSQVAALTSMEKDDRAAVIGMGALVVSNACMSLAALWLIGKTRSGIAVAIGQVASVGPGEFLLIIAASAVALGLSSLAALFLAKRAHAMIGRVPRAALRKGVLALLAAMVFLFTGFVGLLFAAVCALVGACAAAAGVKRGLLMGVLIVPTLLLYL